jgi:hypothetical protein
MYGNYKKLVPIAVIIFLLIIIIKNNVSFLDSR